jgi:hypothetical protein
MKGRIKARMRGSILLMEWEIGKGYGKVMMAYKVQATHGKCKFR